MRHFTYIALILATFLFNCTTSKSLIGSYKGGGTIWCYQIDLMPDSTFMYKFRAHLSSDSATGYYSVKEDSISFHYNYQPQDSASAIMTARQFNTSIENALLANYSNTRVKAAAWNKGRLVYSGIVLKKLPSAPNISIHKSMAFEQRLNSISLSTTESK